MWTTGAHVPTSSSGVRGLKSCKVIGVSVDVGGKLHLGVGGSDRGGVSGIGPGLLVVIGEEDLFAVSVGVGVAAVVSPRIGIC